MTTSNYDDLNAKPEPKPLKKLNRSGVLALSQEILKTAYMDKLEDVLAFSSSDFCKLLCCTIGQDDKAYRKKIRAKAIEYQTEKEIRKKAILAKAEDRKAQKCAIIKVENKVQPLLPDLI